MIVEIDPEASVPPYEQLRTQIAALIRSGELEVGTRLPSIRQLAGDLGLASGTVARAYRELESAGYVRGRVGQGTVVRAAPELAERERGERLTEAARAYATAARELGADLDSALTAVRRQFGG
ncbi:GntR family transcriptional regulator [Planobispora rosea]|uniref:GntR family transcriptional regulator n=1 Tax=Planobispora rosea TaxID=35762 RepID=A0A8J3S8N1_PLARO|nr:GntR family transcriptional regulator [Planobispora rosea]GGT04191.1 GntR family transcriptional regulator [Planobispora rosea]GIH88829.1 GntR family transcriptional regulator [Planobispora rosea]